MRIFTPCNEAFVFQGAFAQVNAACVRINEDSVLLFDTLTLPEEGRKINRYLVDRGLAVQVLVYSHPDMDHLANGYQFRSARVLVQRDAWVELRKGGKRLTRSVHGAFPSLTRVDPPLLMPDFAFEKNCVLSYGGPPVELMPAPGHRSGSCVAWLPSHRLLLAGDAVMGIDRLPALHAPEEGGDLDTLIRTVESLLALKPRIVIPGHGDPGGIDLLFRNLNYLNRLREAVATGKQGRQNFGDALGTSFAECFSEAVLGDLKTRIRAAHRSNFAKAWASLSPLPERAAASM